MTGTNSYKPDFAKLNGDFMETKHAYEACMQAMKNGRYDEAVKYQLLAIDSLNNFNDKLLRELEFMRRKPRYTWAP